jgi:hypothetical protein
MAEEFGGLDRLKRLKEDAKRAAAVIDASKEEGSMQAERDVIIELGSPQAKRKPKTSELSVEAQNAIAMQPVSLSTLVQAATKKRLARASHLQAASEQLPNTQWEIVDQAINEWCKSRGY